MTPTPRAKLPARLRVVAALLMIPVLLLGPLVQTAVSARASRSIVVSLGQQMMWVYKGDEVVLSSYVSTGKPGFETPLGSYVILSKLTSQTMEGVIGGEYYNVPDVPNVMYFTNSGHALHGAYWHNNFGTPMSHGCVNLPMDVAAWLFQWAPVGTPVAIVP